MIKVGILHALLCCQCLQIWKGFFERLIRPQAVAHTYRAEKPRDGSPGEIIITPICDEQMGKTGMLTHLGAFVDLLERRRRRAH